MIFLWVRSIPVQFAVGGVLGTVGIWLSIGDLGKGSVVAFPSAILRTGAISLLFSSVAAPVAGYLLFLVLYLFLDLIRRNLHANGSASATDEYGRYQHPVIGLNIDRRALMPEGVSEKATTRT